MSISNYDQSSKIRHHVSVLTMPASTGC